MIRTIVCALVLAGCANTPPLETSQQRIRQEVRQDRQEERVRQMQDEFNRATGDAG